MLVYKKSGENVDLWIHTHIIIGCGRRLALLDEFNILSVFSPWFVLSGLLSLLTIKFSTMLAMCGSNKISEVPLVTSSTKNIHQLNIARRKVYISSALFQGNKAWTSV